MFQDLYVAEALSTLESWRTRYNQVVKDKGDLELEIIVLNEYVCVGRGSAGRLREVGVRVGGAWRPEAVTSLTWLTLGLLRSRTALDRDVGSPEVGFLVGPQVLVPAPVPTTVLPPK